MQAVADVKDFLSEARVYWRTPRPGEYVSYREIVMLSVGWMAMRFAICWGIGFGVGNEFTGMTLHMNNNQLLVMGYVCTIISYILTPLNAWIVDNLRSKDGKYRVYIKCALPAMVLTLISLWLPYEQVRDANPPFTQYIMIAMLFFMGQIQGYVQSWLNTGMTNMVHVITPNTQERTKIMAITGVIYNFAPTVTGLYFPIMVDALSPVGDKYNMRFYRGSYTPLALFAPLALIAYFNTKERLVLPKSRITRMSFANSMRAVAGNKIFWIRCLDSWNDFLEGAKGNVWNWMVYRAHIMSSSTYGILNTISYNASFWGMVFSPWFIKKFGKKKIKIFKNIIQVFLIFSIGFVYKTKFVAPALFLINTIDRFIDCGEVIDKSIESDMRDNQQYLIGERVDGAFGFIQTYAGGAIGMITGLFIPWVYKKKGFDGNDYSVLDVYSDYNPELSLAAQKKNPDCVLYSLLDTLIKISVVGAIIDVLPWFLYDISETGQKSMIRVLRIRTMVEDSGTAGLEDDAYLEGCEAVLLAREHFGCEKREVPHKSTVHTAKLLPKNTDEEKTVRHAEIKHAKHLIADCETFNEETEIASFVMNELNRFHDDFGKKQLELAELIVSGGPQGFFNCAESAISLANALPHTEVREERMRRKQDIRNARMLIKSSRLAEKHYPDGITEYDPQTYEDAYAMPDDTKEQARVRRAAMKKANAEKNLYATVAAPYLAAKRTVELAAGYEDIDTIMSSYGEANARRTARHDAERAASLKTAEERKLDRERKQAQKRMKK